MEQSFPLAGASLKTRLLKPGYLIFQVNYWFPPRFGEFNSQKGKQKDRNATHLHNPMEMGAGARVNLYNNVTPPT